MTNEEASAKFRIDLWKDKVESLRREVFNTGPSLSLRMHFRSELRIYGLMLGFAKDDLARTRGGEELERRLAAGEKYYEAQEATSEAWREAISQDRNPLSEPAIETLELATDRALCAWLDS
jgi:hypothetical protein